MVDIVLETFRAVILLGIVLFLLETGESRARLSENGWKLIVGGFALFLFASLLDITDNFESLNRYVVIGDTEVEAFLEKFVGFLGGFVLLTLGLVRWIPGVQQLSEEVTQRKQAEEALRAAHDTLEQRVGERTVELEREITERKRTEDFVLAARKEAEFANRAKSEFLANMSHELRTPLNAIIGFSDIIMGEMFGPVGSPKYLEYGKDINDSGTHLLSLINDILDLSKIEAGKVMLHEEAVDVAEAVGSCLLLVKERAETAGVNLKPDIADDLPLLYADERMLKQILINLLSNAIKFTAGGEVTVRAWPHPDDGYVFQVADTGIGIAPEDIPKALAPFQQIDSDLSRSYEGTGLGLPLTKALTESHGGSLDLQSEVGVGTTVTVQFPAERIMSGATTKQRAALPHE